MAQRLCRLPLEDFATIPGRLLLRVLLMVWLPLESVRSCSGPPVGWLLGPPSTANLLAGLPSAFVSSAQSPTGFDSTKSFADPKLCNAAICNGDDCNVSTFNPASCIDLFASNGKHSSSMAMVAHLSIGGIDDGFEERYILQMSLILTAPSKVSSALPPSDRESIKSVGSDPDMDSAR